MAWITLPKVGSSLHAVCICFMLFHVLSDGCTLSAPLMKIEWQIPAIPLPNVHISRFTSFQKHPVARIELFGFLIGTKP
jgi:hypothetical protein